MATKQIREEIADDFRRLGTLLVTHNVCSDISPLMRAASHIQDDQFLSGNKWGYRLENLQFGPGKPKGVMPKDLDEFLIQLSVITEIDKTCKPDDPFLSLTVDIEKTGKRASCGTALRSAWHLDKHVYEKANSVHPLYHFQLGGNNMEDLGDSLGQTFITPPPRLMHPPMDGVIAIDFVLGNYWHEKWSLLRRYSEYTEILERAHTRYWAPFFRRMGNHFDDMGLDVNNNANRLCPFLYIET